MISQYDIGDTVILVGTVKRIEQSPDGTVCYEMREYNVPVAEEMIAGRVEKPWKLVNEAFGEGR